MNIDQLRSHLFVPASRPDMVARAHQRGTDAIILDMEDGVADADKSEARKSLISLLEALNQKGARVMVRINELDSGGTDDIECLAKKFSPPLLVPKVNHASDITAVENCWLKYNKDRAALKLLPMIESPQGMFQSNEIAAASPNVSALVFGSEDFATESGIHAEMEALSMPAQWVALAAASANIPAIGIPGSLGNYKDMALFRTTLDRAKAIGFSGALCVHPKQVEIANEVFQPSEKELAWAKTVLQQTGDGGAAGSDIGMIDAPVLARAKKITGRSN